MRVRLGTAEDIDRIVEMGIRFLLLTPYGRMSDGGGSPQAIGAMVAACLNHGAIFLAETEVNTFVDGDIFPETQVVGMLVLYVAAHPLTGKPYGDEVAWWVEPEHRNGRAGYYLLRSCEDWARQNGLSVLKMVAPAGSKVADYYTRRGYTFVESVFQKSF